MNDLATLGIKIDSSGVTTANRELDKLTGTSGRTQKATDSVTSSFRSQIGVVQALAAAWGAYKLAQQIKDVTLLAARYETLGIVMRTVGNNAGYTGEQMNAFQFSLEKTGISMRESRLNLTRMVQAQIDLTKATELGRIAQHAAVIANMDSSQAFEQMVYGMQTGEIRVLKTMGLVVDFVGAEKKLADQLKTTREKLSDAEVMQARYNAMVKAGVYIEGVYEAAMETAGKQLLSMTRYTENLKTVLGDLFTPALLEIVTSLTGEMKSLTEILASPENQAKIEKWGNTFALVIIDIGAEITRLAMLIDKAGGSITAARAWYYGKAKWFEDITGMPNQWGYTKRYEEAFDANLAYEDRYNELNDQLQALRDRKDALEYKMTDEGKRLKKELEDAREKTRLALAAKRDADAEAAKRAQEASDLHRQQMKYMPYTYTPTIAIPSSEYPLLQSREGFTAGGGSGLGFNIGKQTEEIEKYRVEWETLGSTISSTLAQALLYTDSFGDAFRRMIRSIAAEITANAAIWSLFKLGSMAVGAKNPLGSFPTSVLSPYVSSETSSKKMAAGGDTYNINIEGVSAKRIADTVMQERKPGGKLAEVW